MIYSTLLCSNYPERETPFEFALGRGEVITGWERGISGMCVGEIRKLVLPSDIAYGDVGALPDIPPGATLVYEIELVNILTNEQDEYYDEYYHEYEEQTKHKQDEIERHGDKEL